MSQLCFETVSPFFFISEEGSPDGEKNFQAAANEPNDIYLDYIGGFWVSGFRQSLGQPCPRVSPSPYPFDAAFITDNNAQFDSGQYKFIRGHRVRYLGSSYTENVTEFLEATIVDEQVTPVVGANVVLQIESELSYAGLLFSEFTPPNDPIRQDFWWQTDAITPRLWFIDPNTYVFTEIEDVQEFNFPTSKTQQELFAESVEVERFSAFGGVIRLFPEHNITITDATTSTDPFVSIYTWQSVPGSDEYLIGIPPRSRRRYVDGVSPCTFVEFNAGFESVRYLYETVTNADCITQLGFNSCFKRTKLICSD